MELIIIGSVILIVVLYFIMLGNKLTILKNNVNEAFSTIDVVLKKRWDLIPNVIETVKEYISHEKGLLENIVNLRNKEYDRLSIDEKVSLNNELSNELSKLLVVVENYPDLKSSENFINLSNTISEVEVDIANARVEYNKKITNYNNTSRIFPNIILSSILGYKKKEYFSIPEEQRKNIEVKF